MSIVEQIIQSVNTLSPAAQQDALKAIERIRLRESQTHDDGLENWAINASVNAFADLPANEWDDVYREWLKSHPEPDETR